MSRTLTALLLSISALGAAPLAAQPPPNLLRTLTETRSYSLGWPTSAKPTPAGKAVLFWRAEPRRTSIALCASEVATGKTRALLPPEQLLRGGEGELSPEERARRERMRVSTRGFTSFELSEDGTLLL